MNLVGCLHAGVEEFRPTEEKLNNAMKTINDLSLYFFSEPVGETVEKSNRLWALGLPYSDDTAEKVEFLGVEIDN